MKYRYAYHKYDDRYYRIVSEDDDKYLIANLYGEVHSLVKNHVRDVITYDLDTGTAYHKQWKRTVEVIELDINDARAPYKVQYIDELDQVHIAWATYDNIQLINY